MDAAALLLTYTRAALQQMAQQRGLGARGDREALAERLAPGMYDSDRIEMALADLAPGERELLDRLVELGGSAPTQQLRRELERAGRVTPRPRIAAWGEPAAKGSPWHRDSTDFADVVARLGVLGLAFTVGSYSNQTYVDLTTPGPRLFVPEEILARLPMPALEVETVDEPSRVSVADPEALLHDVYALVSLVQAGPLPLTARGQIVKKALVQLDGSLRRREGAASVRSEDELSRLPFVRALAEELELVVSRPGVLEPGKDPARFLAEPAGERRRRLGQAWLTTRRLCELLGLDGLTIRGPGRSERDAPARVVAARQRVAAEVAELPVGEWVPLDHVVDRIRRRAYELLLPRSTPSYAYGYYGYESSVYGGSNELAWTFVGPEGRFLDDEAGWTAVEGGFVRAIATGALHWLGVVDVGVADGGAVALRLRPDGARLLRGEAPESAPASPNVVVQPNFDILAFEPTGEDVLFGLDRVAERVRAGPAAEYRLTRESVYRAQRAGMDADQIAAFLERVSRTPLPQNVRRTLAEWGARYDRIVVRRGVALVDADAAELDDLVADPVSGSLLGRRIAPTVALVPVANLRPLYDRLLVRGRLPAVTEGHDRAAPNLLTVDPTGRIALHHRRPNVYALAALRALADEESGGGLRLTAESLRRAARSGLEADQVLAVLERYHRGPPPVDLPAMVRRWAKDWGRGSLAEAVLLRVESADILADLLADPELRSLVRRLPGADAFALVRPEAVERLRAALAERGMELDDQLLR